MQPRPSASTANLHANVWAVQAVSRRIPAATCLTQAIAARLLLLGSGHDTELCIGVARDATGSFRAHAWLEREGRIIIGGDESLTFKRMPGIGIADLVGAPSTGR